MNMELVFIPVLLIAPSNEIDPLIWKNWSIIALVQFVYIQKLSLLKLGYAANQLARLDIFAFSADNLACRGNDILTADRILRKIQPCSRQQSGSKETI